MTYTKIDGIVPGDLYLVSHNPGSVAEAITHVSGYGAHKDHGNHDTKEHYNDDGIDEAEPVDTLACLH